MFFGGTTRKMSNHPILFDFAATNIPNNNSSTRQPLTKKTMLSSLVRTHGIRRLGPSLARRMASGAPVGVSHAVPNVKPVFNKALPVRKKKPLFANFPHPFLCKRGNHSATSTSVMSLHSSKRFVNKKTKTPQLTFFVFPCL